MKPSWDDYFLAIAGQVAQRSTCPSRTVGCVIIDPDTRFIISTGYNGAARNTPHCTDECGKRKPGGDWEKCNAIHAELNAIIAAAMNGVSTKGAYMYLTTSPCIFCSRTIINAGIKRVIASSQYAHHNSVDLLAQGGVSVEIIQGVSWEIIKQQIL